MNTMLFYNPKTKESVRVKACQSKVGMWRDGRPSPAEIKSWAAKKGLIHITSRTKLGEIIWAAV
jgi:hypothetical protein